MPDMSKAKEVIQRDGGYEFTDEALGQRDREYAIEDAVDAGARVVMDVVTETMPDAWEDRIRSFWDPRVVIVRLLAEGWTPSGSFVRAPAEDAGATANGFTVAITDCAPLYREADWTPPGTAEK